MKQFAAVRMGLAHVAYCEDFLVSEPLGEASLLSAVLDGCSMGNDSHFASALFGKLLRKIAQQMSLEAMKEDKPWQEEQPETVAKEVLRRLFHEVKATRNRLLLLREELLTTVSLWIHHYRTRRSFVIVIGDGYVCCDGNIHILDQDNRPDYLTYHLGEIFETWYESQTQRFHFESPQDLSIATDGVDTFRQMANGSQDLSSALNPVQELLVDRSLEEEGHMLDRKLRQLHTQWGLQPIDDIAIIRVLF